MSRARTYLVQIKGVRYRVTATVWPADRETGAGPEVEIERVVNADYKVLAPSDSAEVDLDVWTDAQMDALRDAVVEAHGELLDGEAEDRAEREGGAR